MLEQRLRFIVKELNEIADLFDSTGYFNSAENLRAQARGIEEMVYDADEVERMRCERI